jgi:hypothetical protein
MKFAVTFFAAVIGNFAGFVVPLRSPPHPVNLYPVAAVAVNVIVSP